ncbi:signal peptidase I [Brevundimonas sp. M20]|nr:signal peptidase I [Brevundimonas sp. M20]
MSDEHKPHDDHAADGAHDAAHGHDGHAAPEAAAQAHDHADQAPTSDAAQGEPPAEAGVVSEETHAPIEAHDAPAAEQVTHEDAPAEAAPVEAAAVVEDTPGDSPAETHEPAPVAEEIVHEAPAAPVEAVEEPAHIEPVHEEPVHEGSSVPETTATAAAVAGAAAVAASTEQKRPIWSDAGDAPFEDVDTTPVYARGKKDRKAKKQSQGLLGELWEIAKTIAVALFIALVLRILLFQPFTIPSASMEPNLYQGDYIVVSKWSYGYSKHSIIGSPDIFDGRIELPFVSNAPKRGDIVVFKLPSNNSTDYIKRLIGLPGDRIQMVNNVLNINGQPVRDVVLTNADVTNLYGLPVIQLEETFPDGSKTFRVQDFGPGNELDNTPVFEIPAGYYFMMGDNRDNSSDSRVDPAQGGVGLVPAENLIGKAEIILFSWNEGASFGNPVSWFSKVRLSRWFKVLN